jgi:hypothetical protein
VAEDIWEAGDRGVLEVALQADESHFRSHFLDHSSKRCMRNVI